MASAELVYSKEVTKYVSRLVYGIHREVPDEVEILRLYNKKMILTALSNPVCLLELSTTEQTELTGKLNLQS